MVACLSLALVAIFKDAQAVLIETITKAADKVANAGG